MLHDMMNEAVGPTSTLPPSSTASPASDGGADVPPSSVAVRPAVGALDAALGATLPDARACLGPGDPVSRATVTFRSDGTVQNVSVSGGASGKPAEACIRSALMKTRVGPFALDTFSIPVTVRAN
jgi:hypothetical protein